MNKKLCLLSGILSLLCGSAWAASPQAGSRVEAGPKATSEKAERRRLIVKIVKEWGPYVKVVNGENIHAWANSMVPMFRTADTPKLRTAASANTYSGLVNALTGQKTPSTALLPGGIGPTSLGDASADLVYTSLANCVIVDTRKPGGGGAFTAGASRNYLAWTPDFSVQGGAVTNCGIPTGVNSLLVNIQAITPTSPGYFRAWPYTDPMPSAAVMSYTTGVGIQNEIVMKVSAGTYHFKAYSSGAAHLVISVIGYFAAPGATALQCQTYRAARSLPVGFNNFNYATATCPSGYSQVSPYCWAASAPGVYSGGSGVNPTAFCEWKNLSGVPQTVYEGVRCCRVPGR